MKKAKRRIIIIVATIFTVGIFYASDYTDRITVKDVRRLIDSELTTGASTQEIEQFFIKHGFAFGYDKHQSKYHGIIRDVSRYPLVDKAIEVDIYMDGGKYFKAEAYTSYTFL